jgi:hypothetical protein
MTTNINTHYGLDNVEDYLNHITNPIQDRNCHVHQDQNHNNDNSHQINLDQEEETVRDNEEFYQ